MNWAALYEWECGSFLRLIAPLARYIKKTYRISRKIGIYQEKIQDIKKTNDISRNFKFYRENFNYIKKCPLAPFDRLGFHPNNLSRIG